MERFYSILTTLRSGMCTSMGYFKDSVAHLLMIQLETQ